MTFWESSEYSKLYKRESNLKTLFSIIVLVIGNSNLQRISRSENLIINTVRRKSVYICEILDLHQILSSEYDKNLKKIGLKILDVGGGNGDNYSMLLHFAKKTKWTIIDNQQIAQKNGFSRLFKNTLFISEISKIENGNDFDLLLLRGTLQYLRKSDIDKLFKLKIPNIIIGRTVISQESKMVKQVVRTSNRYFEIENQVYSMTNLKNLMAEYNYELKWKSHDHNYQLLTSDGTIKGAYTTILFSLKLIKK